MIHDFVFAAAKLQELSISPPPICPLNENKMESVSIENPGDLRCDEEPQYIVDRGLKEHQQFIRDNESVNQSKESIVDQCGANEGNQAMDDLLREIERLKKEKDFFRKKTEFTMERMVPMITDATIK